MISRDRDEFDDFADCLVVTHHPAGQARETIVGCYRAFAASAPPRGITVDVASEHHAPKGLSPLLRLYLGLGVKMCAGPLFYPPLRSHDYLIYLKVSNIPASKLRHLGVPAGTS